MLEAKSDLKEEQIIDRVKESIAGFKVPKEVIFINELPRNAMGKVQKYFEGFLQGLERHGKNR